MFSLDKIECFYQGWSLLCNRSMYMLVQLCAAVVERGKNDIQTLNAGRRSMHTMEVIASGGTDTMRLNVLYWIYERKQCIELTDEDAIMTAKNVPKDISCHDNTYIDRPLAHVDLYIYICICCCVDGILFRAHLSNAADTYYIRLDFALLILTIDYAVFAWDWNSLFEEENQHRELQTPESEHVHYSWAVCSMMRIFICHFYICREMNSVMMGPFQKRHIFCHIVTNKLYYPKTETDSFQRFAWQQLTHRRQSSRPSKITQSYTYFFFCWARHNITLIYPDRIGGVKSHAGIAWEANNALRGWWDGCCYTRK